MQIREMLIAEAGKVITNGEVYGTVIYLGAEDDRENYYEIDAAEYEQLQADEGESGWSGQS